MPLKLDYRRANMEPADGFHWRDLRPAIWLQGLALPASFCVGGIVTWAAAMVGYWAITAIIMGCGVRRTSNAWAQVFIKWGFLIIYLAVFAALFTLVVLMRW